METDRLMYIVIIPVLLVLVSVLFGVMGAMCLGAMGKMQDDITYISAVVTTLAGRTDSLINQSEGGRLASQDSRVIVVVQPNTVTKEVVIRYQPTAKALLPAGLSKDATEIVHAFSLVALNESGAQLPCFPLKSGEEVSITVRLTNDDLRAIAGKGNHLCIKYWDETSMKWGISCSEAIQDTITFDTNEIGQFVLTVNE